MSRGSARDLPHGAGPGDGAARPARRGPPRGPGRGPAAPRRGAGGRAAPLQHSHHRRIPPSPPAATHPRGHRRRARRAGASGSLRRRTRGTRVPTVGTARPPSAADAGPPRREGGGTRRGAGAAPALPGVLCGVRGAARGPFASARFQRVPRRAPRRPGRHPARTGAGTRQGARRRLRDVEPTAAHGRNGAAAPGARLTGGRRRPAPGRDPGAGGAGSQRVRPDAARSRPADARPRVRDPGRAGRAAPGADRAPPRPYRRVGACPRRIARPSRTDGGPRAHGRQPARLRARRLAARGHRAPVVPRSRAGVRRDRCGRDHRPGTLAG